MGRLIACTIVSNNYLAFARVFARSFRDLHPGGEVWVLIVDRPDPSVDYAAEPFRVLFAADLGIAAFASLAFRYSILELNTAVKPYFLAELARRTGTAALAYFDPDILVLADLGEIWRLLDGHDVVLTPHITAPIADRKHPGERDILLSGIFNLGFLGLAANPETRRFLAWWQEKLHRECVHRVQDGLFVDQRWMDLAPAFLPRVAVLRDPGYNAAYWNLAERRVGRAPAGWEVGGKPLRFFHFSGFDPDRPEEVSKHQDRFRLCDLPQLAPLFADYADRLRAAGHPRLRTLAYGYGRFADGTPVANGMRWVLDQVDPLGRRWPDPFAAGPGSYLEWLATPIEVQSDLALPRAALSLLHQRADLAAAFPATDATTLWRFARWFAAGGGAEAGLAPRFIEPVAQALASRGVSPEPQDAAAGPGLARAGDLVAGLTGDPWVLLAGAPGAWLTADAGFEVPGRPRLPRLALLLHERRPDLQRAFPEPLGGDRHAFALWFVTHGRREYRLPDAVVGATVASLPPRARLRCEVWWLARRLRGLSVPRRPARGLAAAAPPAAAGAASRSWRTPRESSLGTGVNVVGWPDAPTGVGQACRATLAALEAAGVPHGVWPLADPGRPARPAGPRAGLPYDVTLFHVNADMMGAARREVAEAWTAGCLQVAVWFWELSHFPLHQAASFRRLDEVWAPSAFCARAFSALAPIPVRHLPPCALPPRPLARSRAELGLPQEAFLYFHCGDLRSSAERKNPRGLLDAFAGLAAARSGRGDRRVHLLLKVNHPDADPEAMRQIAERCAGLPVTLRAETFSREELDACLAACDAYVSLHRSEGLGLPLIEAMYLGKPVVATGYGGSTDFLDEESGWPVDYELVPLDRSYGPYPAGAVWADPDLAHAAAQMGALLDRTQEAAARAAVARQRVEALYAPAAAGARLARECARLRAGAVGAPAPARTPGRASRPRGEVPVDERAAGWETAPS